MKEESFNEMMERYSLAISKECKERFPENGYLLLTDDNHGCAMSRYGTDLSRLMMVVSCLLSMPKSQAKIAIDGYNKYRDDE